MAKQNRISRTDKSGIASMEVERTFENGSAFGHGALMSEIDLSNMSDDEIFHMLGSGREESTLLPFRALMSEIDLSNMSDDEIFHMLGSGREESTLLPFRPENILCRCEIPGVTVIPRPIEPLDHWNSSFYKASMVRIELNLIYIYICLHPSYSVLMHCVCMDTMF
ncbi:unnamed protein product [Malus baccata var. baccata]